MRKEKDFLMSAVSSVLIIVLMFCTPFQALAQSASNRNNVLENGTQLVLRVNENFQSDSGIESGIINSVVVTDVYSSDGSRVLIKEGTPAFIEFTTESNGIGGKAGKVCLTSAYTKTVDNKKIPLRLSNCKSGGSKLGGVIALSIIFFPIGLISVCMKGSMPKIPQNTTFNATVMQDTVVE